LEIDHGTNNSKSKTVLYKRALESFTDVGVKKWLRKHGTPDIFQLFCDVLGNPAPSEEEKEIIEHIHLQVNVAGLHFFFQNYEVPFLRAIANQLELKVRFLKQT